MKKRVWALLSLLLIIGITLSLSVGTISLSVTEILAVLTGDGTPAQQLLVFHFRFPRTLIAIFAGAGLAISGYLFQTVTHNDLAEPGILSINAGAGLTVLLYLGFFTNHSSNNLLPLIACSGSFFAAFLVYFCGKQGENVAMNRLLLSGVAVNAGISALTLISTVNVSQDSYRFVTAWLSGTIWGTTWQHIMMILPILFCLIPFILWQGKSLEVMALGDKQAIGLGLSLKKKQLFFLFSAIVLAAVSVALIGNISFLGLIAPHLAKNLIHQRNNLTLLMSAFFGAILLLYSDIVGRVILSNGEMAAGIIVSIVGAPYFIFRLLKTNQGAFNKAK
ncbi:iron ABC transporter permease [Tetragenococcus osmophilus]|uniref:ABC transporter permease n=1 Tax=Tetragenococcus osmophilus TaxID=526944 RepID=A0AA37XI81_9ENTE|nr:iron ABC transporter permease [Tetragenococcus osmophilus]GMA52681.1 ABC transporter permease [Alicyclobacillus contaminans]AYW47177.1 iron ABC transporter permease [Tetragenococcus osmophilus]GMA55302.1 ABC transporter permease [Alicyclobacillus contaminans]GMA70968.1 ABC transporter permease [Tetragenococcus osmophilus]GMA73308.1 ABC transporter permease [Tetragenococcus osmophilus]